MLLLDTLQAVHLEVGGHTRVKFIELEWLGNVVDRAGPKGLDLILDAVRCVEENDRDMSQAWAGAESDRRLRSRSFPACSGPAESGPAGAFPRLPGPTNLPDSLTS